MYWYINMYDHTRPILPQICIAWVPMCSLSVCCFQIHSVIFRFVGSSSSCCVSSSCFVLGRSCLHVVCFLYRSLLVLIHVWHIMCVLVRLLLQCRVVLLLLLSSFPTWPHIVYKGPHSIQDM